MDQAVVICSIRLTIVVVWTPTLADARWLHRSEMNGSWERSLNRDAGHLGPALDLMCFACFIHLFCTIFMFACKLWSVNSLVSIGSGLRIGAVNPVTYQQHACFDFVRVLTLLRDM